jgi:hypothetical protein
MTMGDVKGIRRYLKKDEPTSWLHYKVDASLYSKVNKIRHRLGVGWRELLEALFSRLIDEEREGGK